MTDSISRADMATLASTPLTGARMRQDDAPGNWFEAFASAWGKALDRQAAEQIAEAAAAYDDASSDEDEE